MDDLHLDSRNVEDRLKEHIELCNLSLEEYCFRIDTLLNRQIDRALLHVAFYRTLINREMWSSNPSAKEKLSAFPIICRGDVQCSAVKLRADDIPSSDLIARCSSGSSGQPVVVMKNRSLFEFYAGFLIHKMICHGWTPFDTYFLMHGAGIGNITPGISVENFASLILSGHPNILYCYPTYLIKLIDFLSPRSLSQLKMKFIGTHSETSTEQERAYIAKTFSCPVYDDYGATEVGPIASQCEFGNYHVIEHNVYVEILNEKGIPVEPGYMGEVVVTDLRNIAMPLIRYRTGDYATWGTQRTCSCRWRNMRQLSSIEGRIEDSFHMPSGRTIPPGQLIGPLGFPSGNIVRNWQLVQETCDQFRLKIVKGGEFQKTTVDNFIDTLLSILDEPVNVTVEYVATLSDKSEKRRVFVSHVPAAKVKSRP